MMKIQTLNGQWELHQTGDSQTYHATVPGCVHTDLLALEVIPDPFYRDNELQQSWIGETDWTYRRSFTVDTDLLAHSVVNLRCYGLDTIATIRLNDTEIAKAENMFRTYEFDVKPYLVVGENIIEIEFKSPMQYVRQMDATHGEMAGWVEPMRVNSGGWIRKEPCNFGWDWGPKMPTSGIWRDIELVAFDTARLSDVLILQDHADDNATLAVKLSAENVSNAKLTASVIVSFEGDIVAEAHNIPLGDDATTAELNIENPNLWWVRGLGEQPLYDVQVKLCDDTNQQLDVIDKRIGLRVLQLETPDDEWGQAMYFTCNGVKFFAKGANWIPISPYPAEPSYDDFVMFIKAAADANMNMLRVWGGGVYEEDIFYDLCDEYGIAVWQDFVFACGTYPANNDNWLANVREEARQNVQRIRHHASLALWCGNNEIEQGMMNLEWENTVGWDEYNLLFVTTLGDIVNEYDPQRSYWRASPNSPNNPRDPFDSTEGDTHLWEVWHGKQPFEWYRSRPDRFCSEFGFQSFPEPATVYEFTAPEDRNITSYVMEHHQRSEIGNGTIIHYMLDWYRLPNGFDNMVWLSQILQGMAMKYAVEHWRRNMPCTMGTLYWQLNDMWGAPSWASVDWRGRWKALHYMAKRFHSELMVSGVEDMQANTVDIHVTSDKQADIDATIVYTVTDANGREVTSGEIEATVNANTNTHIQQLDFSEQVEQFGKRNLLIWLELFIEEHLVSDNLVLLSRPKHIDFSDPQIRMQIQATHDNMYDVTLTSHAPALYTWLELPDAKFSDNFVDLQPNRGKSIRITVPEGMSEAQMRQNLIVKSLYNTYQ